MPVLSGRFIYRPVREKSVEVVDRQCHTLCDNTGYNEISLSSLSTSDYTKIDALLEQLLSWARMKRPAYPCRRCVWMAFPMS